MAFAPRCQLNAQVLRGEAQGPAQAYATTKRLIRASLGNPLESQLQAEAEGFAGCSATDDFVEGVPAFIAKRPPRFGAK